MFRIARYSGLAATLILLTIGMCIVLLWGRGGTPVFAQVVENVKKATSFSCSVKSGFGSMPKIEFKYYMQDNFIRMEIPGKQESLDAKMPFTQVAVFDLHANKVTSIDFNSKTYRAETDPGPVKKMSNPIESISTIADKDAERIGEEQLNGRKTLVYRLLRTYFGEKDRALEEGETSKLWVDAESGLPVKIAVEVFPPSGDHKTKSSMTVENFVWNKPLDSGLFKLDVPEGFQVVEGKPAGAEPSK